MKVRDRFRGCLLGLAAGDALGASVEFKSPGSFKPVTELVGGGPFGLKPGQWTDDTSQALCLAVSLTKMGHLDGPDVMKRFSDWTRTGYLSSNGRCFDIGGTSSGAIHRFEKTGNPRQGDGHGKSNGCIMRLAPVPLAFGFNADDACFQAVESCLLTHGHDEATGCTRYLAALIVGCLQGRKKADLLPQGAMFNPTDREDFWWALNNQVRAVAYGSYRTQHISAGFDAVKCLQAALWAFAEGHDFRSTVTLAANLGNDSDTVGAVAGQLAGAYYGVDSIPAHWREKLTMANDILALADGLYDLARSKAPKAPKAKALAK